MKQILSDYDYNIFFDKTGMNGFNIKHVHVGKLFVPSGKIIVGDPFIIEKNHTLTSQIKPGEYDVDLCYIDMKDAGNRTALLRMKVLSDKAEYWEMAFREGENPEELKEGEYYGFGVDAGLAGFIDCQVFDIYDEKISNFYNTNPDGNYYDDILAAEFKRNAINQDNPRDIGDWDNHLVSEDGNFIISSTGYGDGYYPCYWGIAKNGQICELIVDFFIIDDVLNVDEE